MLGMALAMPVLAAASSKATQTRLSAETRDQNGRTQATLSVSVAGEDGQPATGTVVIQDAGKPVAGVALDANGQAQTTVNLPPGAHDLSAVYSGDTAHSVSVSSASQVQAQASVTPSFTVTLAPAALSLTAGQTGSVAVAITPVNASALTAPMFVTLSCSGFPDQSSCSFTPENVEILPNTTANVMSSMVISTQAKGTRGMAVPPGQPASRPVAWAVLLPGALGFAGFAFAARRRRWISRIALMGLLGFVAIVGTTACAPRYNYYNHGPNYNLPTPSGTYQMKVSAQTSNGVTATTISTGFALTVQ